MTNPYVPDIRNTFELFDADKSGALSREEIAKVVRNTGCNPTEKELEEMFKAIDTDGLYIHLGLIYCKKGQTIILPCRHLSQNLFPSIPLYYKR